MGVKQLYRVTEDGARPACYICGKAIETHYTHAANLLLQQMCFECDYWAKALAANCHVTIESECYYIGQESGTWQERGYGGHKFTIRHLASGEVITTTNLQYNGVIPERFRADNPNTAEFVTK